MCAYYSFRYFNHEAFSDTVIHCNGQEWPAHRLILSAHSEFFETMFNGPWKENLEKAAKLDEVDANVVEATLCFMYSFDYSNIHGASTMIFNAQVYSVAEKYIIPALKKHAEEKFESAINSSWMMDDFPLAIAEVYNSTPEEDRGLRDLVVQTCYSNIDQLLKKDSFCKVLREISGFAADLVFFRCGPQEAYQCPSCDDCFQADFSQKGKSYCPNCGNKRSDWESYRVKK
ncbi:BTB/POZ protein [Thelonectria olida]|uniref:BTB/POZ protein n=1 Tax=Thelonectria olida TaxID=1576542 RepID=A0A9P8VSM0_9HYPO|nr:BTB/POZ protein [Thelonectria olida]